MAVHLRMTGWLGVRLSLKRETPKHEPYIRVRMILDDGTGLPCVQRHTTPLIVKNATFTRLRSVGPTIQCS